MMLCAYEQVPLAIEVGTQVQATPAAELSEHLALLAFGVLRRVFSSDLRQERRVEILPSIQELVVSRRSAPASLLNETRHRREVDGLHSRSWSRSGNSAAEVATATLSDHRQRS